MSQPVREESWAGTSVRPGGDVGGASAVRDECPQCGSCAVCGSGGRRCVRTLGRPVRGAGLRRPKN